MPVSRYYKGHGRTVMAAMKRKYGAKKGKSVFYGTVVNMQKGTKAQRAAQPKRRPGRRRR